MNNKIQLLTLGAALAILTGCATTPPPQPDPPTRVSFGAPLRVTEADMRLNDRNDPAAVVRYCLALSEAGRHQPAGRFLMEAAQRFRSTHNEFAVACLAAAANEFLLAGDAEGFREAIHSLRNTADRYQQASFDENTLALLSLGDLARGANRPERYTPRPMRELFPNP